MFSRQTRAHIELFCRLRLPASLRDLEVVSFVQGKVAAVCLAGEAWVQSDEQFPIGQLDIGLPSHKSLFQLQAERLGRVQTMAEHLQADTSKRSALWSSNVLQSLYARFLGAARYCWCISTLLADSHSSEVDCHDSNDAIVMVPFLCPMQIELLSL